MEKGSAVIFLSLIVAVLALILAFVLWLPAPVDVNYVAVTPAPEEVGSTVILPPSPTPSPESELNSASSNLDTSEIDQMNKFDTELNALDADLSF